MNSERNGTTFASWGSLGALLGCLGGLLGRLEAIWDRLGAIWGRLGGILGQPWALLDYLGRLGNISGPSQRLSCAIVFFSVFWCILCYLRGYLGRLRGNLGCGIRVFFFGSYGAFRVAGWIGRGPPQDPFGGNKKGTNIWHAGHLYSRHLR